jgi:lipase chaperone LimK
MAAMQRKGALAAAAVVVVAAAALLAVLLTGSSGPQSGASRPAPARSPQTPGPMAHAGVHEPPAGRPAAASARGAARAQGAGQTAAALPDPPASLRGTAVDGALELDDLGRFVPTREAIALFDYFLTASGEEPPETIRARIVAEIAARLPPDAADEAVALLDRYLEYRALAAELLQSEAGPAGPEEAFDLLRGLRAEIFGPDAAGRLFGEEEVYDAVALAQRRRLRDPALTPAEREELLSQLDLRLPEPLRSTRAATLAPLRLQRHEESLRAAGASAEELRAAREALAGAEAADRLEALDRERAGFEKRMAAYRAARASVERAPGLSAEERARAVAELRELSFEPHERARAELLERLERRRSGAP